MPKHYWLLGCMLLLTCCAPAPEKFAIYYGDKADAHALRSYDTLVFDAEQHPPLPPLRNAPRTILAYLSIGEVRDDQTQALEKLKKAGALWGKNPHWGSHYVDISHAVWHDDILNRQIPSIIAKGFDGIMLDTADSALAQGTARGVNNHHQLVTIICSINQHYPALKIMLNRGLDVIAPVAPCIDFLLVESAMINFDLALQAGKSYPQDILAQHVSFLQQVAQKYLDLKIYTVDYWNSKDVNGILHIYKKQRDWGFIPYVATPDLKQLLQEPPPGAATP